MSKYDGHWTERFWSKVAIAGDMECWLWQGITTYDGYGSFKVNGKQARAHRIAWEISTGISPGNFVVMHLCDTPACVNPSHLVMGTVRANNVDRLLKRRALVNTGVHAPGAILTMEQVEAIKEERQQGTKLAPLASKYGVTEATISRVARGITHRSNEKRPHKRPQTCKEG